MRRTSTQRKTSRVQRPMRPRQIARKYGLSLMYVYELIRTAELKGLKIGNRNYVPKAVVERWWEKQCAA